MAVADRVIVAVLFLVVLCGIMAATSYREWQAANNLPKKLAICFGAVCIFAFGEPAWINLVPPGLLQHVELPNAPYGARLTAPDGRVYVVSSPIGRVQRYGTEGFEMGFMYFRKAFTFGMSASGNILICATGGELLTYGSDGTEVQPRASCKDGLMVSPSSYASHAKVPAIAFSWFSALAVPFWHPVAAWLSAVCGGLVFYFLGLFDRPTSATERDTAPIKDNL
jgi:hypothetical protein